MEEKHKSLLRTKRLYLTEELQPLVDKIIDSLLEVDVLNDNMKQDIEAERTKVARVRKLLDILPRRGPLAFSKFCTVLQDMKQFEILKHLDTDMAAAAASSQAQPTSETKPPSKAAPVPKSIPLPVPVPVTTPSGRPVQPTSEPKPERKTGRQLSREVKTEQPSDEVDKDLIDWPEKMNLSPSNARKIVMQDCTHDDLKKILSDSEVYDMSSPVKGRAVIVKNINYEEETHLIKRTSADWDTFRLADVLKRLRFDVKQHVNQTAEKLIENLKKEQEEDQHDSFILVILSYGGVGSVMCTDGKEVPLRDIINVFTAEHCPRLKNKPKLFFIQACGTRINGGANQGISQPDERQVEAKVKDATDAVKSLSLGAGDAAGDIIQGSQDMLVAIATETDVTDDSKKYLSLFILAVWTVLLKFSRTHHVLELLDKVNNLKKDSSGQAAKLCDIRNSLTKKFYFLPGYIGEEHSTLESLPSLPAPSLN